MSIDRVFRLVKKDKKPEKELEGAIRWGQSLLKEGLEVKSMTGPYINSNGDEVYIAHCDRRKIFGQHKIEINESPKAKVGLSSTSSKYSEIIRETARPDPLPVSGKGE